MVVYTAVAALAVDDIDAFIALPVAEANAGYCDSGIIARVNLVRSNGSTSPTPATSALALAGPARGACPARLSASASGRTLFSNGPTKALFGNLTAPIEADSAAFYYYLVGRTAEINVLVELAR